MSMRTVILLAAAAGIAWGQGGIEGLWQGTLDVGSAKLRLLLKVSRGSEGALGAKLDSLDQGAVDIPVSSVSFEQGALKFAIRGIGASFEGALSKDGVEVAGQFTQGPATLPLVLKRTEKPAATNRPQEPKKPYPYDEEEALYENRKAGVKLAGTLTLPRSEAPAPAVILISGSGAQDRNEAVFGHRPFLVLADHLTRAGIAVLRVDDRGVGGSTGSVGTATSEDFAGDVLAGVEFLKGHKRVNARRIGLAGHSEGGLVAPLVAAQSGDVTFVVLMAGPGVTGEQILYEQGALIAKAAGAPEASIAANRALQQKAFAVIKQETDPATIEAKLREVVKDVPGGEAHVRMAKSAWFRFFLTYDPAPTLRRVKCPVLAINGELDLQVPPEVNQAAVQAALQAGGNRDVTVLKMARLNHLFQTAKTGGLGEYAQIEETIAPAALETISKWILERVRR